MKDRGGYVVQNSLTGVFVQLVGFRVVLVHRAGDALMFRSCELAGEMVMECERLFLAPFRIVSASPVRGELVS